MYFYFTGKLVKVYDYFLHFHPYSTPILPLFDFSTFLHYYIFTLHSRVAMFIVRISYWMGVLVLYATGNSQRKPANLVLHSTTMSPKVVSTMGMNVLLFYSRSLLQHLQYYIVLATTTTTTVTTNTKATKATMRKTITMEIEIHTFHYHKIGVLLPVLIRSKQNVVKCIIKRQEFRTVQFGFIWFDLVWFGFGFYILFLFTFCAFFETQSLFRVVSHFKWNMLQFRL